jgi:BASS family bile acid:Na+ symporter
VNFDPELLLTRNVLLGLMMLGLSLELTVKDFKRVFLSPRALLVGLAAQMILLPAFTYMLTLLLKPAPSVALGLILIGACPGAAISALLTCLAGGNVALSISLTVLSTAACILTTPLNLAVWGSLYPETYSLLRKVGLDPMEVYMNLFVRVAVPLFLGMTLTRVFPPLANAFRRPLRGFILLVSLLFVGMGLSMNWDLFSRFDGPVVLAVLLHNALALMLGFLSAMALKLAPANARAIGIAVGIQNSALALILVLNFFDGLGGMAAVAAWWGPWSALSGLLVALLLSRRPLPVRGTP